jgi:hypothetical protein
MPRISHEMRKAVSPLVWIVYELEERLFSGKHRRMSPCPFFATLCLNSLPMVTRNAVDISPHEHLEVS